MPNNYNPSLSYTNADIGLGAARDEGEPRLRLLRAVLRQCCSRCGAPDLLNAASSNSLAVSLCSKQDAESRARVLNSLLNPEAPKSLKARASFTYSNFKTIDIETADSLDERARRRCVPLSMSSMLAIPSDEPRAARVFVEIPKEAMGGGRESSIELTRAEQREGSVVMVLTSASGLRGKLELQGVDDILLHRLFSEFKESAVGYSPDAPQRARSAPRFIQEALVDFLERKVRLQVLCTASVEAPASRPVSLDQAYLQDPARIKGTNKLSFMAKLHPSSSKCICAAHGISKTTDGTVCVRAQTCGRVLRSEGGRLVCPCHTNSVDKNGSSARNVDGVCTENTEIRITCWHGSSAGIEVACGLSGSERRELSILLVAMLEFEARALAFYQKGQLADEDSVAELVSELSAKLKDKLSEVHALQIEKHDSTTSNAHELLLRDATAVDLLREKRVFMDLAKLKKRGQRVLRRVGSNTRLNKQEQAIVHTHGHLFRLANLSKKF